MNLLSLLPTKYLIIIVILLATSAIGYHYYTIHSLNSTISDQKTQIEKLEKDIEKMEGKIEVLLNQPVLPEEEPELDLFTVTENV